MQGLMDAFPFLLDRPALFEPGEPCFWDDPHISASMLATHLDDASEGASRSTAVIGKTVDHWIATGLLHPGMRVLDLGCGPGLYAIRLARAGIRVTGLDLSRRSIAYAREQAAAEGLEIEYRQTDFLQLDETAAYDAAIQVYGELNTFSDPTRDRLLGRIRQALKPGGVFLSDLTTREHRRRVGARNGWHAGEGGFWRPCRHLVLTQGYDYPDESVWLDQFAVIDDQGVKIYRNWFHDYTVGTAKAFLERSGFHVAHLWNDLAGTPLFGRRRVDRHRGGGEQRMKQLETARLIVRTFRPDDWRDLQAYISRPEVMQFERPWDTTDDACRKRAAAFADGDAFWAVEWKESGRMIGHLYFAQIQPVDFRTWTLGYIFNNGYHGHGYATEACRALLDNGFRNLGIHRVMAKCAPKTGLPGASWNGSA